MKYIYLAVLFVLFIASLVAPIGANASFKVVIDPGHGGTDAGAVATQQSDKIKESDITLQISKKVFELLNNDSSISAILTRKEDVIMPLFERSKIAKKAKADLFISIHANSSTDLSAKGAEIYFQSQMPPDEETLFLASRENDGHEHNLDSDDDAPKGDLAVIIDDLKKNEYIYNSQIFSETLITNWKKKLPIRHEPIKQGPFHVLVNVPMPSVLIEVGFVTNSRELALLKDSAHQNKIAEIIYKSIKNYKEKIDKSEFSSHIISYQR